MGLFLTGSGEAVSLLDPRGCCDLQTFRMKTPMTLPRAIWWRRCSVLSVGLLVHSSWRPASARCVSGLLAWLCVFCPFSACLCSSLPLHPSSVIYQRMVTDDNGLLSPAPSLIAVTVSAAVAVGGVVAPLLGPSSPSRACAGPSPASSPLDKPPASSLPVSCQPSLPRAF